MNPKLNTLQPYPFEKLRALFQGATPPKHLKPIRLSIGEPQHETPAFIQDALNQNLQGLANYPTTLGCDALREAIAAWLSRRYCIPVPNAKTQVLPVNGSREALFAFAQCVIDETRLGSLVLCPNPFYQIYEGAALLAGATPIFLNQMPETNFRLAFENIADKTWAHIQLAYICSPGNPSGKVLSLNEWSTLFDLSDKYGFVIASDECYSEIYGDESAPPLGALQAAQKLGRADYSNLVIFSSLSKRSNVPGLRSGFVAGDAKILAKFLLYRTYHGSAMNPAVQQASIAAWNDEAHVIENRRLYREKFNAITPLLAQYLPVQQPDAGFYLWARTPAPHISDTEFTRRLYTKYAVEVLPGSFLARSAEGVNPGKNFVRIALVPSLEDCLDAAERIQAFCKHLCFTSPTVIAKI